MKKLILIVLSVLLKCSFISHGQSIPTYIPTDGLKAWYPFNGNANDESGNGNNGSVVGATLSTDRFGKTSTSYYFDGSAEIDCGTDGSLNIDECTLSAWVYYKPNVEHWQTIFAKYDESDLGSYGLYILDNQAEVWFSLKGNKYVEVLSIDTLASNQWYNVVATHSVASGTKLYLNGMLNASDPTNFNVLQAPSHEFRIGSQGDFYPVKLEKGKIDDIGVWGRVLTKSEILGLYTNVSLSINENNGETSFTILPNPTSGNILIEDKYSQFLNSKLVVNNILGEVILERIITSQNTSIDLSSQASGIYFVQLTNFDNKIIYKKVLIQ